MTEFKDFKEAVRKQFDAMTKHELFVTDVSKDAMWDMYLTSFPDGTNPIYKERTEHDCQCCRQFIRSCGNVVAIINNEVVSIWDIEMDGFYKVVADAMSTLVKANPISDAFLHYEQRLGTDFNVQLLESGKTIRWNHFDFILPSKFVKKNDDIGAALNEKRTCKEVFKRSLTEITVDAAKTALELIAQNSLYRGEEHKGAVDFFLKQKKAFDKIKFPAEQDNFCWSVSVASGPVCRIRNTAIGTFLTDLSDGVELDAAVGSFESKVAPMNYKRTTALVTPGMIKSAQEKVAELGIEGALNRRYAITTDLTINNVLFADRTVKKAMNVFDEIAKSATTKKPKKLDKVEEVSIETFITEILPKADTIELLFENKFVNNLMSLIAPQDASANPILKWGNNFSWSYNGEVTDSIKERVKRAGGNVEGVLRCSLSWFNFDDLDIHVFEPGGNEICFHDKQSRSTSGCLDVDMNAGGGQSREPVENVVWTDKAKMREGVYKVVVHQFSKRESKDVGFDAEIEFGGVIHNFHYAPAVKDRASVDVAEFTFSRKDGIKFLSALPSTTSSKEVWGADTEQFHKVTMVLNSPNHWDGEKTGNKHFFFIMEGCKNPGESRGFYNEFLNEELREHRKVFEVLGSKMRVEASDDQLSGLGFATTTRNSVLCKVTGSFTRTVQINF